MNRNAIPAAAGTTAPMKISSIVNARWNACSWFSSDCCTYLSLAPNWVLNPSAAHIVKPISPHSP